MFEMVLYIPLLLHMWTHSPCLHLNDGAKHQSQNHEYHDPEKKRINFMVRSNKWIIGFLTIF